MQHHWRRLAQCAGFCIIQLISPGLAAAAEQTSEAVVLLTDGRSITGHIDAKTDEQTLWIRRTEDGVVLRSGFDWDRVVGVVRDGQSRDKHDILQTTAQLYKDELEEAWKPLTTLPEPTASDPQQSPSDPVASPTWDDEMRPEFPLGRHGLETRATGQLSSEDPLDHIHPHLVFAEPASLQIGQAGLANWNRDAAIDGLQVSLSVVDDFGQCVPVTGQLEISLIGMRQRVFGGAHINRRQPAFVEIGRWSIPLRGPAPPAGEIWLQLPFSRIDPLDPTIADRTHLHVRLNVPGIGSFEAARIVDL